MSSSTNVDVAAGVTAALVCAGVGFLAEFLLAAWAYRKPGFRSLRVRLVDDDDDDVDDDDEKGVKGEEAIVFSFSFPTPPACFLLLSFESAAAPLVPLLLLPYVSVIFK